MGRLVRFVSTPVSTDSAGNVVDVMPVRVWASGETNSAGQPVDAMEVTDDVRGAPVRIVAGKTAQNSAGQWVDTIPVTGGGGASLAPLGSQIVFWGDGAISENATPGLRSAAIWTMLYLCGKALPSPAWMQSGSGGDMDTIYARRSAAIGQQADIAVFTSQGHNDQLMSTDPDLDPTYWNKWKRNLDAWVTGNPNALMIPVCSTLGSTVGGEATASNAVPALTRAQRVRQLQQAYVAAKADPRVFYVATGETYDPANMSVDAANFYTHMDERGGYAVGFGVLGPAIAARMVSAAKETVLQALYDGTYPGVTGSNIDANGSLAGTTGTKAGTVAPTGDYAIGKRITNNLTNGTSVAVAVSKDTSGALEKQITAVSGTPAAQNTIVEDSISNITVTTTPGQYALYALGLKIDDGADGPPVGLKGLVAALGNYGVIGTSGAVANMFGAIDHVIDTIVMVPPRAAYGTSTGFGARPQVDTRWNNQSLTGRMIMDRSSLRLLNTRTKSAPAYIGNDTLLGASYQLRLTGTLASGAGTLRVETGAWAPYGLTEADFAERRIYKGGTAGNAGIGSGTLVATLSGSTWTWVTSGIVAADSLYVEITVNNGIGGGDVTQRSETVYTAA